MVDRQDARLPPWAEASPDRLAHVERVAALAEDWADRMRVPDAERKRWLRAVWLHDALRDARPQTLARWAPEAWGPPELHHGPASAARAEAEGERDQGVLDAVRYHSLGYAGWDMAGRVLYCADYLEAGRPFGREQRAALARKFPEDAAGVLASVAADRITHLVGSGWPLPDLTVHFWNSLVERSASR
jgi:HD superfamily phosphohydrolase YqeK